jgi:hypothetical protein
MGVRVSIGLDVGSQESIKLLPSLADSTACLVLADSTAEITLERVHLETLRDQLPGVLQAVGMVNAAEQRAIEAGSRAETLARTLTEHADAAEQAGDATRAETLRATANVLTAIMTALHSALNAVAKAAMDADSAVQDAEALMEAARATAVPVG